MRIIYAGKTIACHPHGVTFPSGFCVSQNPNNWSNEKEILKLIDKIIYPYLVKKNAEINLAKNQKAFVIWDVFWGGDRLPAIDVLIPVPANMTHTFNLLS